MRKARLDEAQARIKTASRNTVAQLVKNLPAMQETWGSIPGSERSPGEGNGNPLQYSCLENSTDRGAWQATVHGVVRVGHNLATKWCKWHHLMAEIEELKSLLMKVKEENENVILQLSIQKTTIVASGPITSWEIDGKTVETVADFIFGGSKITADGVCSHEIKRRLLLGRKVMTNLDSILKSRDITLLT